jgi:hypothetical protein
MWITGCFRTNISLEEQVFFQGHMDDLKVETEISSVLNQPGQNTKTGIAPGKSGRRVSLSMMKNFTFICMLLNDVVSTTCCNRPQQNEKRNKVLIYLFVYTGVKCAHLLCAKKTKDVGIVLPFTLSLQGEKEYLTLGAGGAFPFFFL